MDMTFNGKETFFFFCCWYKGVRNDFLNVNSSNHANLKLSFFSLARMVKYEKKTKSSLKCNKILFFSYIRPIRI